MEDDMIAVTLLPDGRLFISDVELIEEDAFPIADWLSNYWSRDEKRCGYISPPLIAQDKGAE